ncbi:hypothetical protein FPE53_25995 [Salmonella enterica subsp. enterica]|uniref:Uncharacterized protein n=1 Tax=Salmonella enterica TaxID=28901 RepID=A0A744KFY4_SALER|nr:hypothetical protein [Salmonella enterica subsp. enterica serovar Aqua]HAF2609195.1 hypothetical protein [Salmonella enterica]
MVMDKTATIDVSATAAGNGGTAVLWSDDYTSFRGAVLAKGGTQSGNGGRVETSSHKNLQAFGDVDTSARAGKGGEWLLDPTDVTIVSASDNANITESSDKGSVFSPSQSGAKVSAGKISEQLNRGANVTIQTSGVNTEEQKGNITIANDVSITKNNGGEATLTLRADNDILMGDTNLSSKSQEKIVSTSGALNLNLLAGKTVNDGSAQVYLGREPTITLNGGNFVVGSALGDEGKINFVVERGIGKTITAKNISIKATGTGGMNTNGLGLNATGNIDINASNVRSFSDFGHDVIWSAGDHLTVNSTGGINLLSNTQNSKDPAGGKTALSAVNNVEIKSSNGAVNMDGAGNGRSIIDISSSKGSVSLSGNVQDGSTGLSLNRVDITSKNNISLNGTTGTATGVRVAGSNFSAASLDVKGVATQRGTGFSLTNSNLKDGLTDLNHVTFKSAGSAAVATNWLDSSIVTDSNREALMSKGVPENLTRIDMNGTFIFNDNTKGWKEYYSSEKNLNGGWIFDNTKVKAGGLVDLKGAGFTNSTITVTNGDLKIDNVGPALLDGSTVNVSAGNVSVHSSKGNISLNKGNISAGKDITLTADDGGVGFVNSTVTSGGRISASGNGGDGIGVKIEDTDFTAGKNINITGQTTGGGGLDDEQYGGVFLYGRVNFHAKNGEVNGTVNFNKKDSQGYTGGVNMGEVFGERTSILFDGSFNIKGVSSNRSDSTRFNTGILNSGGSNTALTFSNGVSTYWGEGAGMASGAGMKYSAYVTSAQQNITVNSGASLNMKFRSENGYAVYPVQAEYVNEDAVGYKFTGGGDVSIVANNNSSSRPTIYANLFSNRELTGSFSINANNQSGNAIVMTGHVDANLVNASITGTSGSSVGITINTTQGQHNPVVNLGNNKITGNSETGAGIVINGKNVTITNGALKGTVTSGTRPGISLLGGEAFTLDGVKVTGESADGAGVSVGGTLQVNNGTYVNGTASGKGAGIAVNGTLTTTSGDGVHLDGKSNSGDGIMVRGETSLMNASVNGTSVSGTGTNIDGPLTLSGTTSVKGKSTTGSGLNIAKTVTVAETDRDKISFTGESGSGSGVKLGSTSIVSGGILTATSVDGPGLQVENGAQAENVEINAQTVNGQAIEGNNNALTATNTSISTVGEAGNTNISENVTPGEGETPAGVVAEFLADKLRESIATLQNELNKKLAGFDGLQQPVTALQVQFDQAVRTGAIGQPDLKRLETLVNGLSDSLYTATELKDAISSLTVGDVGTLKERQETADHLSAGLQGLTLPAAGDISAVAGELNAAKTLQSATVSLQDNLAARTDENGKVRHLLGSLQQQLKDAQEKGTAGGAMLTGMQAQLESLDLQQRSYEEALARIRQSLATVSQDGSSPVTGRQDSVNRLQTALSGVSGISDGQVSALGNQLQQATTGYAQLVTAVQQQGSVNAQTPLQSRDQQDGFHAGGEPTVPVHGYQAQPQNVDIRLCDGEGCRSVTLDVAKPSQGLMVASTESR